MFCSTVIPTIDRPTLSRAVESVLDQDFHHQDFELIIVNDSGVPLTMEAWMESRQVHIINTNRRNRSVARNAGAALAKGRYLHFLDDDDWMLNDAFKAFWDLANRSDAAWLYGGYQLVDSEDRLLEDCHPDESGNCFVRFMSGEWLPLQASFIRTDAFFTVGGFASLTLLLGGDEDVDLSRQISSKYTIAGTHQQVAAIRVGLEGSTTDYANLHRQSLVSREKALDLPGAATRMWDSAASRNQGTDYWFGRIIWIYLVSVYWNLQHRRLFTALSRFAYFALSLLRSGANILSPRFWRGAARPHRAKGWLTVDG